jgi:hypothetical protein
LYRVKCWDRGDNTWFFSGDSVEFRREAPTNSASAEKCVLAFTAWHADSWTNALFTLTALTSHDSSCCPSRQVEITVSLLFAGILVQEQEIVTAADNLSQENSVLRRRIKVELVSNDKVSLQNDWTLPGGKPASRLLAAKRMGHTVLVLVVSKAHHRSTAVAILNHHCWLQPA